MARKTQDLETWCHQKGKNSLLTEWNHEKNMSMRYHTSPAKVDYNSPFRVFWKCQKGHEWSCPVAARTLFNLNCPICNPQMRSLPVGTKHGCLTIIAGFEAYQNEVAQKKIADLEQKKQDFLNGKKVGNIDSVEYFNHWIRDYQTSKYYKCQCECGKIDYIDEFHFLEKKHRYCTEKMNEWAVRSDPSLADEECGLRKKHNEKLLASYERRIDASYHVDYTNTIHESLEVLECINDNYEVLTGYSDKRKLGGGYYKVYKLYKCRCYLCGKEYDIKSSDFSINPPPKYGYRAYGGYYSEAFCDCHKISSFQWIVAKILEENHIPYRVEVSFPDLYGVEHKNLLRYDFSVLNDDKSIKCLIECQGEQHFMPVNEFGGKSQFEAQSKNDELKRKYADNHKIPLIEIPYTCKKYENVMEFLKQKSII